MSSAEVSVSGSRSQASQTHRSVGSIHAQRLPATEDTSSIANACGLRYRSRDVNEVTGSRHAVVGNVDARRGEGHDVEIIPECSREICHSSKNGANPCEGASDPRVRLLYSSNEQLLGCQDRHIASNYKFCLS